MSEEITIYKRPDVTLVREINLADRLRQATQELDSANYDIEYHGGKFATAQAKKINAEETIEILEAMLNMKEIEKLEREPIEDEEEEDEDEEDEDEDEDEDEEDEKDDEEQF